MPLVNNTDASASAIAAYGFNSPFEEFSIAYNLNRLGIPTVYIRAIYMTGAEKQEQSLDLRRYESHGDLLGSDRKPILRQDHNYITIRGFYNGPDTWVAAHEPENLYKPTSLLVASAEGVLSDEACTAIFSRVLSSLKTAGFNGTLLQHNDILIALNPDGGFILDTAGEIEARICNLELIRKA